MQGLGRAQSALLTMDMTAAEAVSSVEPEEGSTLGTRKQLSVILCVNVRGGEVTLHPQHSVVQSQWHLNRAVSLEDVSLLHL